MAAHRRSETKRRSRPACPHSARARAGKYRRTSARPHARAAPRTSRRRALSESRLRDATESRCTRRRGESRNFRKRKVELADHRIALTRETVVIPSVSRGTPWRNVRPKTRGPSTSLGMTALLLFAFLRFAFRLRFGVGCWLRAFALLPFFFRNRFFDHLRRIHPFNERHRSGVAPPRSELYD